MNDTPSLIQPTQIEQAILLIRGQRVMLDRDLAALYDVETKNLNKAVQRNLDRFPPDFMFQLTPDEADGLRFQLGTLKRGQHFKYLPHVFAQEGVAMLSSVLRSDRAVQVNVAIMPPSSACAGCWRATNSWPGSSPNWNAIWKVTTRPSSPSSTPSANSWPHPPSRGAKSASTPSAKR